LRQSFRPLSIRQFRPFPGQIHADGQRREKRIVVNGGGVRLVEVDRWLAPLRLLEFYDGREWWRLIYDPERAGRSYRKGKPEHFML
jgi:hypothetical protein